MSILNDKSNKTRFSEMNILFGDADNERVSLFLATLYTAVIERLADENNNTVNPRLLNDVSNLYFRKADEGNGKPSAIQDQFLCRFNDNSDISECTNNIKSDVVHPEWKSFHFMILEHINKFDGSKDMDKKNKILETIKQIGSQIDKNNFDKDHLLNFKIGIIKLLFSNLSHQNDQTIITNTCKIIAQCYELAKNHDDKAPEKYIEKYLNGYTLNVDLKILDTIKLDENATKKSIVDSIKRHLYNLLNLSLSNSNSIAFFTEIKDTIVINDLEKIKKYIELLKLLKQINQLLDFTPIMSYIKSTIESFNLHLMSGENHTEYSKDLYNRAMALPTILAQVGNNINDFNNINNLKIWSNITDFTYIKHVRPNVFPALAFNGDVNTSDNEFNPESNPAYDNLKHSGYSINQYLKEKFLKKKFMNIIETGVSTIFDDNEDSYENKVFRKPTDPTKLFMMDDNNKEIDISDETVIDAWLIKTTKKAQCDTIGVDSKDEGKCGKYIMDCLAGDIPGSFEKCKNFMLDPNFWVATIKEVNMIPYILVQKTLESLSVGTKTGDDGYLKYVSSEEWLESIHKRKEVTDQDYKKIAENVQLIGYIKLLLEKINKEPTILNPNYSTADDTQNNYDNVQNERAKRYGVPFGHGGGSNEYSSNRRNLDSLKANLNQRKMNAKSINSLTGGNPNLIKDKIPSIIKSYNGILTSTLLKKSYESLTEQLKINGKNLSHADTENIKKHFDSLVKYEKDLVKLVFTIERYVNMMSDNQFNDKNNILNYKELVKIANNSDKKLENVLKSSNKLLEIVEQISDYSSP